MIKVSAVTSHSSALIGLGATWVVLAITTAATYDPSHGVPTITLTFLMTLGAFSLVETLRYARALRKTRTKSDKRQTRDL